MRPWWKMMAVTLLCTACVASEQRSGYIFSDKAIAQIKEGESTRKDVIKVLGSPVTRSEFEVERWHYVGSKSSVRGALRPTEEEREVLTVEFDEEGLVKKVEKRTLADAQNVDMVERVTKTEGKDVTMIEQFIGNFGKFNKQGVSGADAAKQ